MVDRLDVPTSLTDQLECRPEDNSDVGSIAFLKDKRCNCPYSPCSHETNPELLFRSINHVCTAITKCPDENNDRLCRCRKPFKQVCHQFHAKCSQETYTTMTGILMEVPFDLWKSPSMQKTTICQFLANGTGDQRAARLSMYNDQKERRRCC